jgi:hypothetical protein
MGVGVGYRHEAMGVRKPQRGGVNSDLPMILCLFYAKCSRCFRNAPGRLSHKKKKKCPLNVFWGPRLAVVTSPPYTKTQSKAEN